jgi:DNA-binding CsgD family transcriptional regulator
MTPTSSVPAREVSMGFSRNGKLKRSTPRQDSKVAPAVAHAGMLLLDLSMRPIAFDRGASEIFTAAARRGGSSAPAIPGEVLDAIRRSKEQDPASPKVRFTLGTRDYICRSYLLESPNPSLQATVMAVYLERDLSLNDAVSQAGSEYHLTEREHQVLKEIAFGLTSKEVAERMNISPNTVKTFLRMIMMKMGVSTRSGVIAKLLEHG